jgi:tRNA pseudouridine55 synthase
MIAIPDDVIVSRPPLLPTAWDAVVLPVDKPGGITSHDVLRRLKRRFGGLKMGHAGTLDPMATGLLVCLIGRATKLMRHFLELPKEYSGTIRLGEETPSHDADTPVTERRDANSITREMIVASAEAFRGSIRQVTPIYSAVRLGGERLYKKARRGETVSTPVRDVEIYSIDIGEKAGNDIEFNLTCSSGTYVRAVARDIGRSLGVGAHLVSLRRQRIGTLHVSDAWNLESIAEAAATCGSRAED